MCVLTLLLKPLFAVWAWVTSGTGQEFLGAIVGAFGGAYLAFKLETKRRAGEEIRRRIGAANVALLTLHSMWWDLASYESQVVRKAIKRSPEVPLWLRIAPATRKVSDLGFDASSLVFLLEFDASDLLPDVLLQEQRYRDFYSGLELRDTVMSRARESMERERIGARRHATDQELLDAIGLRGIAELRTVTAGLLSNIYRTLEDMAVTYKRLCATAEIALGKSNIRALDLPVLADELKVPTADWVKSAIAEIYSRPALPEFAPDPPAGTAST